MCNLRAGNKTVDYKRIVRLAFLILIPVLWSSTPAPAIAREGVTNIWVDTDLACGADNLADVDDCLALTYLLLRSDSRVIAISTIFGNVDEPTVFDCLLKFLAQFHQSYPNIKVPMIYRGAKNRKTRYGPVSASVASNEMDKFFSDHPGEIYLLGPATNLAAAYSTKPKISDNIYNVLFVGGRRGEGRRFFPDVNNRLISFRDFNLAKDTYSFKLIYNSPLQLHLAGYEIATVERFTPESLKALKLNGPLESYLSENMLGWTRYWEESFGIRGFFPFDLVAAKSVHKPESYNCVKTTALLSESYFLMFRTIKALKVGAGTRPVVYCGRKI